MSPLIDKSWSRYIWMCIGNSDKDSGSIGEHETEVANTLSLGQSSPSTPLLGTSTWQQFGQSINIPTTRSAMGAGSRSCSAEVSDAVPENGSPPSARTRSNGSEGPPSFEPYDEELSSEEITHNVFELLQQDLRMSKDLGWGYIYALSMPGYIKIGRTRVSITDRLAAVERCAGCKLRVFNKSDYSIVPNYERVEKLIHEELRNERRRFACPCRKKATGSEPSMHDEWFAISEAKAAEVIDRWRKYMYSAPYTELKLRPAERLKIDYYNMCGSFPGSFQWNNFINFPRWKIQYMWLYNELFGSRPQRPGCSRWESLCKHWKSNLLFYATPIMLLETLSFNLNKLPSTPVYIGYLVLVNKIIWGVWGGFALLYAA